MLGSIVSSILGGIASAIGKGLTTIFSFLIEALMTILSPIIEILMKYIVAPFLVLLVNLINYVLAMVWYNLAIFILGLIDYVQILFKLLAGLPVDGVKLKLSGSTSDSDLLLQLIRSDDIKNVFLSMCIVGIFLLVITTIFQIIKVEYTTEGAKNAKGPILNKAFKGLCNMIMIPALCIVGVFIGNQVLELLDTATKENEESSISGQLFVAAAAEAHYGSGDIPVYMATSEPHLAIVSLTVNLIPIVWNSVMSAWGINNDANLGGASDPFGDRDETTKKQIDSNFAKKAKGYNYYNLGHVSTYYDYSRINYLLLIFGGCILIKTLYFTCFGMIVRLYQCGMLFIISPAVIGMTPINEGGLGKWRSDFIGSAISAYGVVLAVNIYMVLVKILLSVEFVFEATYDYVIGARLMEGLLKCIIVIGGAVYIEKFSGQIGGYFGAKDALAQGKEMEKGTKAAVKSVAEGAVKAVGTGVKIAAMATGVGGAAVGAAKGLGAAMKAGGAAAKVAGGSKLGNFARGVGGGIKGGARHVGSGLLDARDNGIQQVTDRLGIKYESRKERKEREGLEGKIQQSGSRVAQDDKLITKYSKQIEGLEAKKKQNGGKLSAQEAQMLEMYTKQRDNAIKAKEINTKERDDAELGLRNHNATINNRIMLRKEGWKEAGKAGWRELTFGGQLYSSVKKQLSGYEDAAIKKGGDAGYLKTASEQLAKVKEDKSEKEFKDRNKKLIAENDAGTELVQSKLFVEQMIIQNSSIDKQITSAMSNLDYFQQKKNDALAEGDNDRASRYDERLIDGIASIAQQFGIAQKDIVQGAGGKWEITAKAQSEIKMDPNEFAGIVHKAFDNMKKGMKQEEAIKNAVSEAISGRTADFARMIQKNVEEVLARWDKGK